jgi:hypothetical protein
MDLLDAGDCKGYGNAIVLPLISHLYDPGSLNRGSARSMGELALSLGMASYDRRHVRHRTICEAG